MTRHILIHVVMMAVLGHVMMQMIEEEMRTYEKTPTQVRTYERTLGHVMCTQFCAKILGCSVLKYQAPELICRINISGNFSIPEDQHRLQFNDYR